MAAPAQAFLLDQFVQVFWTPYDPLDLASGSLDPLGFTRGYLALADQFLPSFTTVTTVPRYVSMLCAALATAQRLHPQEGGLLSSSVRKDRLKVILSYERAWALACGLAAKDEAVGDAAVQGLRGIRSVTRRLDSLSEKYVKTGSYNLLSNQLRYGGMGVYSTFMEETHLASMSSLSLRSLGQKLAEAFPAPDLPVHDEDARLSWESLKEWGIQAHTSEFTEAEGQVLKEALQGGEETDHADHVRWSSLRMLARLNPTGDYHEGRLLQSLAGRLDAGEFVGLKIPPTCHDQIRAVLEILEPYEQLYQAALFLFDAVRGAATDEPQASLANVLQAKPVGEAVEALRQNAERLPDAILQARQRCPRSAQEIEAVLRDSGVLSLVEEVRRPDGALATLRFILGRHQHVQQGKFDRGGQKAPWFQMDAGSDSVHLTTQRNRLLEADRPERWTDEGRHPYRTYGAFRFIDACRIK